jgi:hypothetical protein
VFAGVTAGMNEPNGLNGDAIFATVAEFAPVVVKVIPLPLLSVCVHCNASMLVQFGKAFTTKGVNGLVSGVKFCV